MPPTVPRRARRRIAAGLLVVALAGAGCSLAGCGDDGGGETAGTTRPATTAGATTGSTATTSDSTAPPTPSTPSTPTAFAATNRDAASELKAAWEAGDRARAAAIAPGDVVDALFVVPAGGFEIYGCDSGEFPTSTCTYRNRSTGVNISLDLARSPEGWQASSIYVDQG